jgi:hypothetical protein
LLKFPIPNRHGWHVDSEAEPFDPDNVAQGAHKLLFRTGMDRLDGKIRLFKGKLGVLFNNKTVLIKKGNVVMFHAFLMHSSAHPKGIFENITELDEKSAHYSLMPLQKTKLTLYFDACRSRFASPFLKVSAQRAKEGTKFCCMWC